MFSWSWDTIYEVTAAIQSYHHDLAARLVSGKSPTLEEARAAGARRHAAESAAAMAEASGIPPEAVDAARAAGEARAFARDVAGLKFAVSTDPVVRIDGPAVFAAARAAKERGASPDEVQAIIAAGLAGKPLPVPPG